MTLVDNTYRYDGNANCIEKHTLSGLNRYTYDSLGQLVKAEYPTGTEAYSYDRAGNRLTRTTQNSREEYRHDAAGRLTGRSVYEMLKGVDIPTVEQNMVETKTYQYEYDRQGNTLSDGENTYRYDSLNRLVEIRTKSADIQKNHYDGEGLRAELEENGRLVSFIFDNEKAVCETDADRNTIRYIRGYELISSDSEKAKTYYHYASDELGSTTHVTDESGKILNRYEYDAFGNFTVKEEKVENRFCFTGEQYDPASNLYYLRARFYSPAIGSFLNEDTSYGDGLNLYAYCHNNPLTYVDPTGHWCEKKQQETVQKYKDKGYSDQDAETMANYERLREEQGVDAAEKYLQEQVRGSESGKYSNLDEGLNFSNMASQHMGESGRQVPVQTLQDAIRYGEAMPDPRGSNATMYYTTMYKNGKMYNLEVLYDATTNTVYHFEYARKAMGNLPAIK